jgi:uncharacterized protein YyaL (SSP411 family)
MISSEGGFYSAEDADSPAEVGGKAEEGKFYVWTAEQLKEILSEEERELVAKVFNVEAEGNFTEEATGGKTGENILHLKKPLSEIAEDLGMKEEALREKTEVAREKLYAARQKRVRPHKDDKILTDWNGLMIAALAKAGRALDEREYVEAGKRAADFILGEMRNSDGRLLHRYRGGEAAVGGFLDDYAYLTYGLIELYQATFELKYLKTAKDLTEEMTNLFWDDKNGGFYLSADDAEKLIIRKKEIYDGAYPSGNSIAMLDLLLVGRMTGDAELEEKASELGRAFSSNVSRSPYAHTMLMCALDFAVGPSYEVVIVGEADSAETKSMLKALWGNFIPNKVVLFRPAGEESPEVGEVAPFTKSQTAPEGKATAYVCREYNCKLPTADIMKMLEPLKVRKK